MEGSVVPTLVFLAIWTSLGAWGVRMVTEISSDPGERRPSLRSSSRWLLSIFGLLVVWFARDFVAQDLSKGHVILRLTRRDRKNPCLDDLRSSLRMLKRLQGVPGEEARNQRKELEALITRLRALPKVLKDQQLESHVVAMRPEYEALTELTKTRLELYEKAHQEAIAEIEQIEAD